MYKPKDTIHAGKSDLVSRADAIRILQDNDIEKEFLGFDGGVLSNCAPRGAVLLAAESAAQEAVTRRTWYRVLSRYG